MLHSGGVESFGASKFTVNLSRQQSAHGGGLQTQAEALSEFWGVQRQQHQADSSGVVSLQDRGLPGETRYKRARCTQRTCILDFVLHITTASPPSSQSSS